MNPKPESILPKRPIAGPAMKASLAFITGIIMSGYIRTVPDTLLVLCGAGILLLIVVRRNDFFGSLCALAVMGLTGLFAGNVHNLHNKPLDIPHDLINATVCIEGDISDSPRHTYGNTYCVLNCTRLDTVDAGFNVSGKLPCVVYGRTIPLTEGSTVLVKGKIQRIRYPLKLSDMKSGSLQRKYTHRLTVGTSLPEPVIVLPGTSFFSSLRMRLSRLIDRYPYGGHRELLRAMTIGARDGIPQEIRMRFAQTGIAHILAVSGLHVGILAIVFMFLLNPLPIFKKYKFILLLAALWLYAGICGFRPPVTRSVIMVSMLIGPLYFERMKNTENSLFAALIAILAVNPQALYGPSLQLSFTAVWTITIFYTPLTDLLYARINGKTKPWIIQKIIGITVVSLLAFVGTAPVAAAHFGVLPVYGIFANIPGIPLAFLIVTAGTASIIATSAGMVTAPLAAVLSFFTGVMLRILTLLTDFVSNLPGSTLETGPVSLLVVIGAIAWLYSLSRSTGRPVVKKALLYIPMIIMLVVTWNPIVSAARYGHSKGVVVFFDVGQGDAALIGYGKNRAFLIDTGPHFGSTSYAETVIIPTFENLGITTLDGIFISHMHADHTGGMSSIVNTIQTDRIFCSTTLKDSLTSLYGNSVTGLCAGDSIAFNEGGMLILSPGTNPSLYSCERLSAENNSSMVMRCDIAGTRILFTGDIETDIQKPMVSWGYRLRSDILKIPHHGAKGLNQDFIRAVAPAVSIISCGAGNRYGHPARSTLTTLSGADSHIWRTDLDGAVMLKLPEFSISTFESIYYNRGK